MSHVTNIILTGHIEDFHDAELKRLNDWLEVNNYTRFAKVDQYTEGPKAFEMNVYLVGVNYLDETGFLELFRSLDWSTSYICLHINDQNSMSFVQHEINEGY